MTITAHDLMNLFDGAFDFALTWAVACTIIKAFVIVYQAAAKRHVFSRVYDFISRKFFCLLAALCVAFIMNVLYPAWDAQIKEDVVARVVWKERVSYGAFLNTHMYLVFTVQADGRPYVMANVDSYFWGKHDSSDLYAMLHVGEWYKLSIVGTRVPLFSKYPNIIGFEKSDAPAQ
jgi:hypothetical protein